MALLAFLPLEATGLLQAGRGPFDYLGPACEFLHLHPFGVQFLGVLLGLKEGAGLETHSMDFGIRDNCVQNVNMQTCGNLWG